MQFLGLLIVLFISAVQGQDRKIVPILNPQCLSCPNSTTLVYIRAEGPQDTIHQIWDFTAHLPTVIYSLAGVNSTLELEWDNYRPKTFNFSETPKYSFAATILAIYEYNDLNDNGYIDSDVAQTAHYLRHVDWVRHVHSLTDNEATLLMKTKGWKIGDLEIKLDLLPFKGYANELPHLIHTSNSTLIDVSMVNFTTLHGYNSSRFALNIVLVSTDSSPTMHATMRKSLDDEHTPGVFEVIEILTPESYAHGDGGFMQFRPVAYTEQQRTVASSTIVKLSDFDTTIIPPHSTLEKYFTQLDEDDLLIQDVYVSFGEPGDGFYKQHNYTAWSFTFGYGSPPVEGFSLFVILIISIGLGVPVLLALSGVIYLVCRRYRQRNAPTRLTDEE